MTYMFIFAHPDDETVACAGTILQLIQNGDDVILVSATDGSAGEVMESAALHLKKVGSVGALRRTELKKVCEFLNVTKLHILDFTDSQITNEEVWGKLTAAIIDLFDQYKPDVVVTFDHSGWYFHLDHVGVSIATTLAYHQAANPPAVLLFSSIQVNGTKWKYVFPETLSTTHYVDVTAQRETKIKALNFHASQDMERSRQNIMKDATHKELYQIAFASEKGKKLLKNHPIFRTVKS